MAGTNVSTAKRVLVELLKEHLPGVQVTNGMPANMERVCVYTGRATGTQELAAMRSPDTGRPSRDEQLLIGLHIRVYGPNQTITETDAVAEQIGGQIEDLLAGEALEAALAVPGLLFAGVSELDLDPATDDDAAISTLSYRLAFESTLE